MQETDKYAIYSVTSYKIKPLYELFTNYIASNASPKVEIGNMSRIYYDFEGQICNFSSKT